MNHERYFLSMVFENYHIEKLEEICEQLQKINLTNAQNHEKLDNEWTLRNSTHSNMLQKVDKSVEKLDICFNETKNIILECNKHFENSKIKKKNLEESKKIKHTETYHL